MIEITKTKSIEPFVPFAIKIKINTEEDEKYFLNTLDESHEALLIMCSGHPELTKVIKAIDLIKTIKKNIDRM